MPKLLPEAILFFILLGLVKLNLILSLDVSLIKSFQLYHPLWFKTVMEWVSFLGEPRQSLSGAVIISMSLFIKGLKKEAVIILLLTFWITGLTEVVKLTVGRPRPDPHLIYQYLPVLGKDSFPSFHAIIFLSIFGYLWTLTKNRLVQGFFLFLILIMGLSRVYLGEHYPSDVLGSYLLGVIFVKLSADLTRAL